MANGPLIYVDKNRVVKKVYGGSQIISQIYNGSDIVFSNYPVGGTLFESSTPGTYSFTPDVKGEYEVTVVGAGGGGACTGDPPRQYKCATASGGSGSIVIARFFLTGGTTYSITVGAGGSGRLMGNYDRTGGDGVTGGASKFWNKITCNGGTGGHARWTDGSPSDAVAGVGGTRSASGYKSLVKSEAGNNGNYNNSWGAELSGGASKYNGYGAGGGASTAGGGSVYANAGSNGYVKITYIGHATS